MSDPMTDAEIAILRENIPRMITGPAKREILDRLLATLDAATERAVRAEGTLSDQRHADEKHILEQTPVEFLRSRNRKRPCDSDGFIGCERCQTMLVCSDLEAAQRDLHTAREGQAAAILAQDATLKRAEAAEKRAAGLEGLLRECREERGPDGMLGSADLSQRIDAALSKKGE